jgi:hypothetical protein
VIDREALLKSRLTEQVVDIPDVGQVRIRSLSGNEVSQIPVLKETKGVSAAEEFVLCRAVVDPILTPADAAAWREAAPHDELVVVLGAIFELSGLSDDALKQAVKSFRDGQGEAP